ncbi:MAG: hypothetical protein U0996_11195 [Planctomycetaceae bacterium]
MRIPSGKRPVLCIAAITVALAAYWVYSTNQTLRNSYTVWWAADMVIEHMTANDNQWPASWDDLRDDYETCVKRSGRPWTFDEIQSRVIIDFSVDGKALVASAASLSRPSFRVIWLSDGSDSHWESHEPNTMILNYLTATK